MMVPAPRLVVWFALVVVPFAGIAVALPAAAFPAAFLLVAFAAFVAVDAGFSRRGLAGLGVTSPGVVRFSRAHEGEIPLYLRNEGLRIREFRLGLPVPEGFQSEEEIQQVHLPPEHEMSVLKWRCTPSRRGAYRIRSCYAEQASRLGFWSVRRRVPVDIDLRVYPDLLSERKHVPALFMRRGMFGIRAQRQIGKGKEFEQLREYVAGDSFDDIHWKATAKRQVPVTKVFQIERTQEVYVVIDASRLSSRVFDAGAVESTPEGNSVLERYLSSSLILGRAAQQQGDLFGLAVFTNRLQSFVRAEKGEGHFRACLDALCRLETENVTPDFGEIFSFIRTRLRRRALIVFLTQLDDPALSESFLHHVELIRRQHMVLVNMLTPPLVRPLFSSSEDVEAVDDVYRHLGGHLRWETLRELQAALRKRGVQFFQMTSEKLAAQLVTQYMNVKQRQRL